MIYCHRHQDKVNVLCILAQNQLNGHHMSLLCKVVPFPLCNVTVKLPVYNRIFDVLLFSMLNEQWMFTLCCKEGNPEFIILCL